MGNPCGFGSVAAAPRFSGFCRCFAKRDSILIVDGDKDGHCKIERKVQQRDSPTGEASPRGQEYFSGPRPACIVAFGGKAT